MELHHFDNAAAFVHEAEAFLVADEAVHCLILGITAQLVTHPERFPHLPYLATVMLDDAVVAAAMMTPQQGIVLSLSDPAAVPPIAADVAARYGQLPSVNGPSAVSHIFAEEWRRRTGQPYRRAMAMRIYQLTAVIPPPRVPGTLRRATMADRDLLIAWTEAGNTETRTGHDPAGMVDRRLREPPSALYLWEDGRPVSMAGPTGPTPHGIRVNAVYTPPEHRGRGYARACVAALSQQMLDSGYRFCSLYTDLSNQTSNRLYQSIGYVPICDVDAYEFLPDLAL